MPDREPEDSTGGAAKKLERAVELCHEIKDELAQGQHFERAARMRDIALLLGKLAAELRTKPTS